MPPEISTSSEWLQPFSGQNTSLVTNVNFLWRHENFYIMDNHLAAAWCWLQHPWSTKPHSILHIDAHFDTAVANQSISVALDNLGNLRSLSFANYRALSFDGLDGKTRVFRWDNYLTIYQSLFGTLVDEWIFSTYEIGHRPNFEFKSVSPLELLSFLSEISTEGKNWIINIDLDFFLSNDGDRFPSQQRRAVFEKIRDLNKAANESVVTMALSPECCGSWDAAIKLCEEACGVFELPFRLPVK